MILDKKHRYKRLELSCAFKFILEKEKDYIIEILPVFNRNGHYYDRELGYSWSEYNGRAYMYPSELDGHMFLYDIDQFQFKENRLNDQCLAAIEILMKYGKATDTYKEMYDNEKQIRYWALDANAAKRRFHKFMKDRGIKRIIPLPVLPLP